MEEEAVEEEKGKEKEKERIAREILREMGERGQLEQWKPRLNIFADAADIEEWDSVLLNRYPAVYANAELNLKKEEKLKKEEQAKQARQSLQEACKGLSRQLGVARRLLDFSVERFGREKELKIGKSVTYPSMNTSLLTGFYTKDLGEAERALCYAESQLSKLLLAQEQGGEQGRESAEEFEEKALHAGSLTFLAMEIAETLKMCCFGFYNAGTRPATEYTDFPPVETEVGLGAADTSKPVVVFLGSDFLPAWFAVEYLRRSGAGSEEAVEICGVGAVGHDIPRFYKRGKVLASAVKAREVFRAGIPDVVVVSGELCFELDVLEEAKRVGAKVVACGLDLELEERSAKTVQDLVSEVLEKDLPGVRISGPEKAGELAVRLAVGVKKIPKKKGKIKQDKFLMRAGRGPMSELEWRDLTFGIILGGNGPGMINILGCGDRGDCEGSGNGKEVAEIARYFLERNALVTVSGCVAADVAKYFDEEEGGRKFLFEQYIAAGVLKGLVNFGGCTAISHVPAAVYRGALVGSGYVPKANWTQIADYLYARLPVVAIIWGAWTETTFAVASGLVRSGIPVVVGPSCSPSCSGSSSSNFKRFFLGDKNDRSKWWMYDGVTGEKKEVEPCPVHMLVPVETKEEAIAMSAKLLHRPLALRDPRLASLEAENEAYKNFFGEYSDDWHLFVRSEQELHVMRRAELLRKLKEEHGWEIEGMRIKRARHRSGELMEMAEYNKKYGIQLGRYSTLVKRLVTGKGKEK